MVYKFTCTRTYQVYCDMKSDSGGYTYIVYGNNNKNVWQRVSGSGGYEAFCSSEFDMKPIDIQSASQVPDSLSLSPSL